MSVKGKTNNPNGRKKGVPNKSTTMAREAIARFVDDNSRRMQGWLDSIAEDSPKDAFDCVTKLMEYHLPKLQRTEVDNRHVDKDGEDLHAKDLKLLKDNGYIK